jgi:hypothetical protein
MLVLLHYLVQQLSGDTISIVDYAGTFATNNITLTSSLNIEGETVNKILTTNREGVTMTYADATQGWVATIWSKFRRPSTRPNAIRCRILQKLMLGELLPMQYFQVLELLM